MAKLSVSLKIRLAGDVDADFDNQPFDVRELASKIELLLQTEHLGIRFVETTVREVGYTINYD